MTRTDTAAMEKSSGSTMVTFAGFAALALALLGLAGRVLSYPLNRDENMFVSVASQLGGGDLYRDLGFNHLPNLAFLLGGVFAVTGTEHYLLTGRLVILAAWLTAILAIWLIVKRLNLGAEVFFAASALLLGNALLLGPSGMIVSNNFLPIPLTFLAFYFLIGALSQSRRAGLEAFLAGLFVSLTIGLKVNFIMLAPAFALAALLAPSERPFRERLLRTFLPLAIGGIVGGIPALAYLAIDPDGFLAHTLRYFTELQPVYWQGVDEPKTVGLADKILLAEQIWFANSTLLGIAGIAALGASAMMRSGVQVLADWRIILLVGLLVCSLGVAFVPTPSFKQYFVPLLPFLILLFIVMAAVIPPKSAQIVLPLMFAVAVMSLVMGATRILPGLVQLTSPSSWETIAYKREVGSAGEEAGLAPGARVAALTPVMALEGGYGIYPEFAAGQFVYRVAPYMSEEDRAYYRTTSPDELEAFFDADQPDAILVNRAEPIEEALAKYAISRGFAVYESTGVAEGFDLYVAPQ